MKRGTRAGRERAKRRATWLCLWLLLPGSTLCRALERVTLSNGFEMRCDHHVASSEHTRLYLGKGEESYIDLRADEVAGIEALPDPPPDEGQKASGSGNQKEKLTQTDIHEMMAQAGEAHNIDVDLLASVVKAESGGNARAVSRAGARGLMQLMPGTAAQLGVSDSFRPDENLRGGSIYLDSLLKRYHENLSLALAAYNAGPEAVDRYHGVPPYAETRAYVARVIHEFNRRVMARERAALVAQAPGHAR